MKNLKFTISTFQFTIILIMFFIVSSLSSQIYVAGAPITPGKHILIEVFQKRKHTIAFIDYGSNTTNYVKITTPDGDTKKFISSADVFNFLHDQGFEFLAASGDLLLFRRKESNN